MLPLRTWVDGTLAVDLSSAALPVSFLDDLRNQLTLYQGGLDQTPVPFFEEQPGWIRIPRGFLFTPLARSLFSSIRLETHDKRSHGKLLPPGTHVAARFGEPPFPTGQPQFIADMVSGAQNTRHGGLCLAPTRSGKTLCSIEAACRLGGSTLILVNRDPLHRQWTEAIEKHVRTGDGRPVRVGSIREDRFETDAFFTVAMMQTLVRRQLDEAVRRAWRTVIIDEAQSAPCELVWSAVRRIENYYTLGLTATPDRSDGLTAAIYWVIGPVIAQLRRKLEADVAFILVPFQRGTKVVLEEDGTESEKTLRVTRRGQIDTVSVEKSIYQNPERIARVVEEAITAKKNGRRVLILVGLREHVARLHQAFLDRGVRTGLFIGGSTNSEQMKPDVVIATYEAASAGIDFIPPFTLLILAGPRSDVRQAVGRILQPQAPCRVLILDVVDDVPALLKQAGRRKAQYLANGFAIRGMR